jgi:D-alanyl-D-alanine carboxypeptidase (penicillin-binding protein 5/6)
MKSVGILILTLFASLAHAAPASSPPEAPSPAARAWLLVDHDSGEVLAEHRADERVAPASLTKLMTAYLLFERLRDGKLKLSDAVTIGERAAALNGSRLFLRAGSQATVEQLLQGMLVRSANDATLALVEHAAGSETEFVAEMNAKALQLGLASTRFVNGTGLDADGQLSTARDLTRLAGQLIRDFPKEYARWFAVKEFTFNDIKQHNRNALLWRDASVDGVKTGRTRAAGHCLIASARRGDMRLIATVLGAPADDGRFDGAQRLLEHGFRHFETRLLYAADSPATRVRVWMGSQSELPLGLGRNLYLTLPRGLHEKLRARLTVKDRQVAPIALGQHIGTLALDLGDKLYAEYPLVALTEVGAGNLLRQLSDRIELWWR